MTTPALAIPGFGSRPSRLYGAATLFVFVAAQVLAGCGSDGSEGDQGTGATKLVGCSGSAALSVAGHDLGAMRPHQWSSTESECTITVVDDPKGVTSPMVTIVFGAHASGDTRRAPLTLFAPLSAIAAPGSPKMSATMYDPMWQESSEAGYVSGHDVSLSAVPVTVTGSVHEGHVSIAIAEPLIIDGTVTVGIKLSAALADLEATGR